MIVGAGITPEEREAINRGEYRYNRWRERLAVMAKRPRPTPRWYPLIPHPEMIRCLLSPARFRVVVAGRGSGKTEPWKRELIRLAMGPQRVANANYAFLAPTYAQAKLIYWRDLKALTPKAVLAREPIETELALSFRSGCTVRVIGMDKPQRVEGTDLQLAVLDEYADWKPGAFEDSVLPMLDRVGRQGRAVFLGRPRSRNHFYQLVTDKALNPAMPDWDYFHWRSRDIMDEETIASAAATADPRAFARNYEAEFEDDAGRVYYAFDRAKHVHPCKYDPSKLTYCCFDFNVRFGVAFVAQEQPYRGPLSAVRTDKDITVGLGEVWIEPDSNSEKVARALAQMFKPGGQFFPPPPKIALEGDPAGGARKTSGVAGNDWEIIVQVLRHELPNVPIVSNVERAQPMVKPRVNAMNTRLLRADGKISMLIDPTCTKMIRDLESVVWDKDGEELEGDSTNPLTHISDALAYLLVRRHPAISTSSSGQWTI